MNLHSETAALTGSIVRNGGNGISKSAMAQKYPILTENSTADYAAAKVASRFRLRIETARLVCRLSGLGGSAHE